MDNTQQVIEKITAPLKAMHLAQLTAFALTLPPLYFCREYLSLDDLSIIKQCQQRLINLLKNQEITEEKLLQLLADKEYFDADEARLRVSPEPVE